MIASIKKNETPKPKKLKSKMVSFRLSQEAIAAIRYLSARLSNEAHIQISMTKIIEIAVFNAETKTLAELLELDR